MQVRGRVEVPALVPGAPPLDVVHADRHSPLPPLHRDMLRGVGETALPFGTLAVAALELTAHLHKRDGRGQQKQCATSNSNGRQPQGKKAVVPELVSRKYGKELKI